VAGAFGSLAMDEDHLAHLVCHVTSAGLVALAPERPSSSVRAQRRRFRDPAYTERFSRLFELSGSPASRRAIAAWLTEGAKSRVAFLGLSDLEVPSAPWHPNPIVSKPGCNLHAATSDSGGRTSILAFQKRPPCASPKQQY